MKIRHFLGLFGMGVALAAAAGCGGSGDGDDDGAGGSAGSAGSGGTAGSGGSAGMAPMGKCVDEEGPLTDAVHGEMEDMTVTQIASTCGVMALTTMDDPTTFITNCIQTELDKGGPGLSSTCLECPVETVQCAIRNCASHCAADPTATECIMCLCGGGDPPPVEGDNCYALNDECTGVPNTACATVGL